MAVAKSFPGNFFEDFAVGLQLHHPVPRTVTRADASLYKALYPDRRCIYSSDVFARRCGLRESPLCDLAVFHIVFGKSVQDISLNAFANLGYASGLFQQPVYAGDTLSASSTVIGVKENSSGKSGIVWVRTKGFNQSGETVLEFVRWVMVAKKDKNSTPPESIIPELPKSVSAEDLPVWSELNFANFDFGASGEQHRLSDYSVGENIQHGVAITVEDAEHILATRLWQNTAKVHFDTRSRPDGRRLIYGGHVISLALALTGDGLANAQTIVALNGGAHVNPCFAGDTVEARTEVIELANSDVVGAGAIRLRTIATKAASTDANESEILLDIDYWALMPN